MPLLTWRDREKDLTRAALAPYRLLEPVAKLHYGEADAPNLLIEGDNLDALKAVLPYYGGQVKCVFIDPPYNTQAADFDHYLDNMEHSQWLSMMQPRLELLNEMLHPEGVIFIQIDDKEMAYLRIICDAVFGRRNFLNTIVVKTSDPSGHKTVNPSPYSQTEYVLMYAKERSRYQYEQRYVASDYDAGYNRIILNPDENYQEWRFAGLNEHVANSLGFESTRKANKHFTKVGFRQKVAEFAMENRHAVFQATAISDDAGRAIVDVRNASKENRELVYRVSREGQDDIYVTNGRQIYFYSSKVREVEGVVTPAKPLTNLWTDIPWNGIANEGGVQFKNGKKPERLLRRCIEMTTEPGDLVLDSFLGSGTTAAVAHKMGRRWIGIEMGDHARTHAQVRMKAVVDGEQSGASVLEGWKGGGGFRYMKLGPQIFDEAGHIREGIKFEHLAAHVWFAETRTPRSSKAGKDVFLGEHQGTGYYLLYNGILGEQSATGGNVLSKTILRRLPKFDGPKVIYGEACLLPDELLDEHQITFRQTPYDLKAR